MNYIPAALFASLEQDGERLSQLINGYIAYLKRNKQGESEPGAKDASRDEGAEYKLEQSATSRAEHEAG